MAKRSKTAVQEGLQPGRELLVETATEVVVDGYGTTLPWYHCLICNKKGHTRNFALCAQHANDSFVEHTPIEWGLNLNETEIFADGQVQLELQPMHTVLRRDYWQDRLYSRQIREGTRWDEMVEAHVFGETIYARMMQRASEINVVVAQFLRDKGVIRGALSTAVRALSQQFGYECKEIAKELGVEYRTVFGTLRSQRLSKTAR
jgi:hypothetical protein